VYILNGRESSLAVDVVPSAAGRNPPACPSSFGFVNRELLSREEQLQIAPTRIHREQDNTLEAQILINKTLREYKDYKREQRRIKSKLFGSINLFRKGTNRSLDLLSELLDH
jgi:hypothetical protein